MLRIDPLHIAVRAAIDASLKSPCLSKRGVAIWRDGAVISTGYNHQPSGFCCTADAACKANCGETAIHAEEAAILSADVSLYGAEMLHVKTENGVLVPSGPPSCLRCSRLIVETRLSGMWLFHESGWHCYDAAEFHHKSLGHHSKPVAIAPGPC